MEIPIMIGALIIGALFVILKLAKVGKTKKTGNVFLVVGLISLGISGLAFAGIVPQIHTLAIPGIDVPLVIPGEEPVVIPELCPVEDTTITLSAQNAFLATAASGDHRYRINDAPAKTVSDAGTFTASPGDILNIFWGNESSSDYYAEIDTVTVPCKGTKTFYTDVYRNGTLTLRVFNEEGNLIDTVSENETLGSGDTVNLAMDIQGQFEYGFPHGGIIVAEYDKNNYTDVQVQLPGTVDANVPSIHTLSATTNSAKAYTVSSILSNEKISGTLYIEVKSGVDPESNVDITLTFYPNDYYIDEDLGGLFAGPAIEDEDDVQTFSHITSFTVNVD